MVVQAGRPAATAPPPTDGPAARRPHGARPYGDPNDPATWDRLAQCESGGNWAHEQRQRVLRRPAVLPGTWQNVGGAGYPHQASKAEQIKRGQILQARAGWGQWPHCARQLGYL